MVTYKGVDNEVIRLDVDAPQVIFLVLSGAGGPGLLACRGGGGPCARLHTKMTLQVNFLVFTITVRYTLRLARAFLP
jgi:hypothetical protein